MTLRVAVTGAAGQIGYALLFRLASGALHLNQNIRLQLLELPQAQNALKGVAMELEDCAFPFLENILLTDSPKEAFKDADLIFLVGAKPRSKGMERADLLSANALIFKAQGEAIAENASPNAKILVVGNPANTNAWIAQRSACKKGFQNAENFHAMMRLDHNRALNQLAQKLNLNVADFENFTVWGNHSPKMFADWEFCKVKGEKIHLPASFLENEFQQTVGERGAKIIEARGLSSAASAASAAIDHMRDWVNGAPHWVTMGIPAPQNPYHIPEGLVFGFPCVAQKGEITPVLNLELSPFAQKRIAENVEELEREKNAVAHLV